MILLLRHLLPNFPASFLHLGSSVHCGLATLPASPTPSLLLVTKFLRKSLASVITSWHMGFSGYPDELSTLYWVLFRLTSVLWVPAECLLWTRKPSQTCEASSHLSGPEHLLLPGGNATAAWIRPHPSVYFFFTSFLSLYFLSSSVLLLSLCSR